MGQLKQSSALNALKFTLYKTINALKDLNSLTFVMSTIPLETTASSVSNITNLLMTIWNACPKFTIAKLTSNPQFIRIIYIAIIAKMDIISIK